ncbi:sodium/potassium-transporting ATPase subunit beta-1 [Strongylocentrotus purpuratus]|uniref:Sodium/potassium-transporting ATPase subunit beta n=1 Tax=Strongylocentrotus purpuratus TaxID=7668 RepID=A0A7M7RCC3_STRPU|nr:sodium/potassium-transporting ATPase subunit beta-1 [Strongylocentrotus purpuratus]|eukprot:XP_779915.1 PREDICTED: sodium/potassium-transporting ATPase subunit beta-1 [Strongylocentrotus purpuratus]
MGGDDDTTFGQRMSERWSGFKHFLWNSETREFLGRGGSSWGKISLFYFIFYVCLAAFWACMLLVFMQTVDYDRPKWVSYVSTPGLVVTPSFIEERISYTPTNERTIEDIFKKMNETWNSLSPDEQEHTEECDPLTEAGNKTMQRLCSFNREHLGQYCTPENYFGYTSTEPCVFVNMNRVWGWTPEDPEADATDVPEGYVSGHILITCKPYKDKDVSSVNGTTIYPPTGLPFAYYPYVTGTNKKKQALYVSPYVAVRVTLNAEEAEGKDVKIQCEAYTGNIEPRGGLYDIKDRSEFTVIFNLGKSQAKDEM